MVNITLDALASPMAFEDKTIACRDCNQTFTFSAGEQEFFAAKKLQNEPKRCPNCRVVVKVQRDGKDTASCAEVPCHECGVVTLVPFKPSGRRPVYCAHCMHNRRATPTDEGGLPS